MSPSRSIFPLVRLQHDPVVVLSLLAVVGRVLTERPLSDFAKRASEGIEQLTFVDDLHALRQQRGNTSHSSLGDGSLEQQGDTSHRSLGDRSHQSLNGSITDAKSVGKKEVEKFPSWVYEPEDEFGSDILNIVRGRWVYKTDWKGELRYGKIYPTHSRRKRNNYGTQIPMITWQMASEGKHAPRFYRLHAKEKALWRQSLFPKEETPKWGKTYGDYINGDGECVIKATTEDELAYAWEQFHRCRVLMREALKTADKNNKLKRHILDDGPLSQVNTATGELLPPSRGEIEDEIWQREKWTQYIEVRDSDGRDLDPMPCMEVGKEDQDFRKLFDNNRFPLKVWLKDPEPEEGWVDIIEKDDPDFRWDGLINVMDKPPEPVIKWYFTPPGWAKPPSSKWWYVGKNPEELPELRYATEIDGSRVYKKDDSGTWWGELIRNYTEDRHPVFVAVWKRDQFEVEKERIELGLPYLGDDLKQRKQVLKTEEDWSGIIERKVPDWITVGARVKRCPNHIVQMEVDDTGGVWSKWSRHAIREGMSYTLIERKGYCKIKDADKRQAPLGFTYMSSGKSTRGGKSTRVLAKANEEGGIELATLEQCQELCKEDMLCTHVSWAKHGEDEKGTCLISSSCNEVERRIGHAFSIWRLNSESDERVAQGIHEVCADFVQADPDTLGGLRKLSCEKRIEGMAGYCATRQAETLCKKTCGWCVEGYSKVPMACVEGTQYDIVTSPNNVRKPRDCANLCDQNDKCLAFQFGVDYDGKDSEKAKTGDCKMKTKALETNCNGEAKNWDLYVKFPTKTYKIRRDRLHYYDASQAAPVHEVRTGKCPMPLTREDCKDSVLYLKGITYNASTDISDGKPNDAPFPRDCYLIEEGGKTKLKFGKSHNRGGCSAEHTCICKGGLGATAESGGVSIGAGGKPIPTVQIVNHGWKDKLIEGVGERGPLSFQEKTDLRKKGRRELGFVSKIYFFELEVYSATRKKINTNTIWKTYDQFDTLRTKELGANPVPANDERAPFPENIKRTNKASFLIDRRVGERSLNGLTARMKGLQKWFQQRLEDALELPDIPGVNKVDEEKWTKDLGKFLGLSPQQTDALFFRDIYGGEFTKKLAEQGKLDEFREYPLETYEWKIHRHEDNPKLVDLIGEDGKVVCEGFPFEDLEETYFQKQLTGPYQFHDSHEFGYFHDDKGLNRPGPRTHEIGTWREVTENSTDDIDKVPDNWQKRLKPQTEEDRKSRFIKMKEKKGEAKATEIQKQVGDQQEQRHLTRPFTPFVHTEPEYSSLTTAENDPNPGTLNRSDPSEAPVFLKFEQSVNVNSPDEKDCRDGRYGWVVQDNPYVIDWDSHERYPDQFPGDYFEGDAGYKLDGFKAPTKIAKPTAGAAFIDGYTVDNVFNEHTRQWVKRERVTRQLMEDVYFEEQVSRRPLQNAGITTDKIKGAWENPCERANKDPHFEGLIHSINLGLPKYGCDWHLFPKRVSPMEDFTDRTLDIKKSIEVMTKTHEARRKQAWKYNNIAGDRMLEYLGALKVMGDQANLLYNRMGQDHLAASHELDKKIYLPVAGSGYHIANILRAEHNLQTGPVYQELAAPDEFGRRSELRGYETRHRQMTHGFAQDNEYNWCDHDFTMVPYSYEYVLKIWKLLGKVLSRPESIRVTQRKAGKLEVSEELIKFQNLIDRRWNEPRREGDRNLDQVKEQFPIGIRNEIEDFKGSLPPGFVRKLLTTSKGEVTDYHGVVSSHDIEESGQCEEICDRTPGCMHYMYQEMFESANQCWISSSCSNPVRLPDDDRKYNLKKYDKQQASICPNDYPICFKGDCVVWECRDGGREFNYAPHADALPGSGPYNALHGVGTNSSGRSKEDLKRESFLNRRKISSDILPNTTFDEERSLNKLQHAKNLAYDIGTFVRCTKNYHEMRTERASAIRTEQALREQLNIAKGKHQWSQNFDRDAQHLRSEWVKQREKMDEDIRTK